THKYPQPTPTYPFKTHYINYLFKKHQQYYILSTKQNKIKSLYATPNNANLPPLKINHTPSHIFQNTTINPHPSIKLNPQTYNFQLSHQHIKTQTFIKYPNLYPHLYVHHQSNQIMRIPFLH
ncbi:CAP-associated domain-containing protein, partial [Staphylococcus haemolyticus]|uniref:CAP-associated domain-containing protein n=1 Tax=Staphylococcus haemolyticus TaxID=1283 RepID=UPI0021B444A9